MNKTQVRRILMCRLKRIPRQNHRLYRQLFNLPQWWRARVVAVTLSTKLELDTRPIIQQALQVGKQVVVPEVLPDHRMQFVDDAPGTRLVPDRFGILEPIGSPVVSRSRIDLMVVPGLGFAIQTRDRLGFGGGYYDRYLKSYQGYTVALARPGQWFWRPVWPVNRYDEKLDLILR